MTGNEQQTKIEERRKFISAFNDTMIRIWQEQITLLGVIDTGMLLNSLGAISTRMDNTATEAELSQGFREYGLWQNYGTGRETPRGNSGDIGRAKVRKKRVWFSRKYFASVFNIRDFLAISIGEEFCGVISNMFDKRKL